MRKYANKNNKYSTISYKLSRSEEKLMIINGIPVAINTTTKKKRTLNLSNATT